MRLRLPIAVLFYAVASTAYGQSYFFVANTRPPDAFLSLRTQPSTAVGQQIEEMPNGTLLEVLERRSDGWWLVRNIRSQRVGWALSRYGSRIWIECCRSIDANFDAGAPYEPRQTSWERTAILNSVRAAVQQNIMFKVNYLRVFRAADYSIAYVDLEDASGTLPLGAYFLQTTATSWKVRYSVGGEGAHDCKDIVKVIENMIRVARSIHAPDSFFPKSFHDLYAEVRMSSEDNCVGITAQEW